MSTSTTTTEEKLISVLYWGIKGAQVGGYFCLNHNNKFVLNSPCSSSSSSSTTIQISTRNNNNKVTVAVCQQYEAPSLHSLPQLLIRFSLKLTIYILLNILLGLLVLAQFIYTGYAKIITPVEAYRLTKTDFITSLTILIGFSYLTLIKLSRLFRWKKTLSFWNSTVRLYELLQINYGLQAQYNKTVHRELKLNFCLYILCSCIVIIFQLATFLKFCSNNNSYNELIITAELLEDLFRLFVSLFLILHHLGLQHYILGYIKLLNSSFIAIGNKLQPGDDDGSETEIISQSISAYQLLQEYIGLINAGYGKLLLFEVGALTWISLIASFHTVAAFKNGVDGSFLVGNITSTAFLTFINLFSLFNLCREADKVTESSKNVARSIIGVGQRISPTQADKSEVTKISILEFNASASMKYCVISCDGYMTLNKPLFLKILGFVAANLILLVQFYDPQN